MNFIPALIIVVTIGNRASAVWVTIEDFNPSELVNLSPKNEHELMLQKLAQKEDGLLASAFYYEILANSIGNSFFQFQQDTNTIQENNAIIRAMIAGTNNLLMQYQVMALLMKTVSVNGVEYVHTFNSFSVAFSLVCGDIDYYLKNETFYTTLRDENKKQTYSPPNKIYHYGIAKSWKDELGAVEQLLNEPKIKHLYANLAWMWIMDSPNSALKDIVKSVRNLAKEPDKFEEVQNIYERSIDEVIPLMKRIDLSVALPGAKRHYFNYLLVNLTTNIWSRIMEEIPDWNDYFECDTTDGDIQLAGSGRCGERQVGKGKK